jgi:hypothetical protein
MRKPFRQQITELACEIDSDVHHGECFYEKEMLEEFIANLDKMKNLAREYYISNRKEIDE